MSTKRTGLGRSLSALLQATEGEVAAKKAETHLLMLPIDTLKIHHLQIVKHTMMAKQLFSLIRVLIFIPKHAFREIS